jgi:hypothetical protein
MNENSASENNIPKAESGGGGSKGLATLFRILGGLLIVASIMLPFMSLSGYSLFGKVSGMAPDIVSMYKYFILNYQVVTLAVIIAYSLLMVGAILIVLGGLLSFVNGAKGGAVGLVGVIFEVAAFSLFSGFSPQMIIFAGPGYYAALSGSITAIASKWAVKQ